MANVRLSTKRVLQIAAAIAVASSGFAQIHNAVAVAQTLPSANAQAAPSGVTIKAKTQVVLLDVIATDKHGNPITDLKREDFTVLEKGKPQQVESFNIVDVAKRSAIEAPKLPPGVYTNKQAAAEKENQLIVLLLDALNTPWKDQAYARQQMLNYLKKNRQSGQRMAIYGLATNLIRMQDFTDDPALLQRVLDKHKGETSPLLDNPDTDPQVDTSTMPADMAASVAAFQEQEAAYRMDMRVRLTLDALKAIGRELAGYPGRKKLIWVTASIPVTLEPGENSGFESQRFYVDDIMKTTSLLRDAQVSVYTVDAQGLVGLPVANAEFTGRTSGGRMMNGPQFAAESARRMNALNAAHDSARMLAEGTGGLAFYNRNDLDTAVMKSVADGAIYYALSYAPDDKSWNGQYRKIEVKVNRPGVELRYRKGYFARDPEAAASEAQDQVKRELDIALTSLLPATGVTFYGSAQPLPQPVKEGLPTPASTAHVAGVRFLVEPRGVFFQETKDNKQHCDIQFVVGVFSAEKLVKASGNRLDCNVEPATYTRLLHDGILFQMKMETPEGKSRIRLLVRDNLSGKMGSLDVPYPPAMPQAKP